jgi:hypothetical protein
MKNNIIININGLNILISKNYILERYKTQCILDKLYGEKTSIIDMVRFISNQFYNKSK